MKSVRLLALGLILESVLSATFALAGDGRCGARCLLVAARAIGRDTRLEEVDQLLPDFESHASVSELEAAAHQLGLVTSALHWEMRLPPLRDSVAILPIAGRDGARHFVVALKSDGEHVLLLDFPHEPGWLHTSELVSRWNWDGNAMHLAASSADLLELQPVSRRGWMRTLSVALVVLLVIGFWGAQRSGHTIRRCRTCLPGRSGVSLVELLVAMSIVGLLISLLAPAVQSSREAARRVECRNHLKQLSLACQSHHATHGHFPAAAVPYISTIGPNNDVNLSVHARLLPFLDQMPLYRKLDRNEDGEGSDDDPPTSTHNPSLIGRRVGLFECPTDRIPSGGVSYRVCIGTGPYRLDRTVGSSESKVGAFALTPKADRDIVDGLSATAFFSEKLVGDQDANFFTANRDYFLISFGMSVPADAAVACQLPVGATPASVSYGGSSWLFSGYDHTWYNHAFSPNASTPDCSNGRGNGAFTARSFHTGGVHVAFGDGAVKFIGNSVNLAVWHAISSRKGREPVPSDF